MERENNIIFDGCPYIRYEFKEKTFDEKMAVALGMFIDLTNYMTEQDIVNGLDDLRHQVNAMIDCMVEDDIE